MHFKLSVWSEARTRRGETNSVIRLIMLAPTWYTMIDLPLPVDHQHVSAICTVVCQYSTSNDLTTLDCRSWGANWKRRWHVIVICSFNSECRGGSVDMVLINLLIWLVCGVSCFSFWDKGFVRRRERKGFLETAVIKKGRMRTILSEVLAPPR